MFDWMIGGDEPELALVLARETSWALLDRVRGNPKVVERVIEHAQNDGIDDIAELWANAQADSLAGVLWRLYLLRKAVESDPDMTTLIYRRGVETARTIDPIIAGAAEPITPDSLTRLCNTILTGVFVGDFASALDRAWAYARVMSHGSASLADDRDVTDETDAAMLTKRAYRFTQIAEALHAAAQKWRNNELV
jgi:hypothetical protein